MKNESFGIFVMKILFFKNKLKKINIQKNTAHNNKELITLGFSDFVVLVSIFA